MLTKYKLAPQTKFYDSMGANWKPFIMFSQFPNLRSKICNTDVNGLRFNEYSDKNKPNSIFEESLNENKKKAVIIGNSFSFGEGASSDRQTISSLLSRNSNYHFYNLSGRGFSGFQEITNFFLHLNHLKNIKKIIIISGCNDAFLPYYKNTYENFLEPTHGYKLFKSSMKKAARGWKNKFIKFLLGSFLKKINWDRINSFNWKNEIVNNLDKFEYDVPNNPDEHLSLILENNIRQWSIISKGMQVEVDYVLQPVGSWVKKKYSEEETKLFSEEISVEGLEKIYKYINTDKYNYMKEVLKFSTNKYKLNFLDLNEHFSLEKYNNEWLFLSRFHFNDKGNNHLSEHLISKLIK